MHTLQDYENFLQEKSILHKSYGFMPETISDIPFPFQQSLIRYALRKGRSAIMADTGLGKTIMELEWGMQVAKHTQKPVLIVAPLYVAYQTIDMAKEVFGYDVNFCDNKTDIQSGLNITNYEKLDKFIDAELGGIVFDESSIFKGSGAYFKDALKVVENIDYRLCCSATPAPNSIEEMGMQSEVLGIMTLSEMQSTFFVNRQEGKKGSRQGWQLRPHANKEGPLNFWKWLASWAMAIKKPSDLGFDDTGYNLPKLNIHPIFLDSGYVPDGQLFFTGLKGIQDRSQVRRDTLEPKCEYAANLAKSNDDQWIIWGGLNSETDLAYSLLKEYGAVNVQGSDDTEKKIRDIQGFVHRENRILISKTKICGMGANFQNCHNMIFVGLSDSYESFYQAIKRIHRFKQDREVNVYVIMAKEEQEIWENVQYKMNEAEMMTQNLIKNASQYQREEMDNIANKKVEYQKDDVKTKKYHLMLGDSVERIKELDDNSIHLSVYSPPFEDLFVYSNTPRDLGNSSHDDFYRHYGFIVEDLLRITKPGRKTVVHVSDIHARMSKDGRMGLKDFSGDVIRLYEDKGWEYWGRIPIAKNPQATAIRLKAHELMFATMKRDSARLMPVQPDYFLVFTKPGKNEVPVLPMENKEMNEDTWINWAGNTWMNVPNERLGDDLTEDDFIAIAKEAYKQYQNGAVIWDDVKETEVLRHTGKGRSKVDEDDTKHICPLQLEPVERAIKLWTNPGETVFTPFMGSGTEVYQAVKYGRYGIGIELKPEYFYNLAVKNVQEAARQSEEVNLFTLMGV